MLILLTLALSITEFYIVARSLDSSVDAQVDSALRQHQLVKYAIQSDMLSAYQTEGGSISKETMQDIAQELHGAFDVGFSRAFEQRTRVAEVDVADMLGHGDKGVHVLQVVKVEADVFTQPDILLEGDTVVLD